MGSKVASDIFQRMLDSVYIGLPGVTGVADDMVIFGRKKASSILIPKISKIELKQCHLRQDRMYGSRILILGNVKKL